MKKLIVLVLAASAIAIVGIQAINKPAIKKEPIGRSGAVFCAPAFNPSLMLTKDAPLFEGLGNIHHEVSTASAKAQQYFDQGLALLYGFNHGEAGRSFKAAAEHDPQLAMAYWGIGMVLGPNYNAALNNAQLGEINTAMDKARQLSAKANAKEKALIEALSKRFPREAVNDLTPFVEGYAEAMKKVFDQFPDDADIAALYADALMNAHPWNLWQKNGEPQPWTPPILEVLEKSMKKWPSHPALLHLYIHATEASKRPEMALDAANKLTNLTPAAGHLLHMPSHIYIRTGNYHEGVLGNIKAVEADSQYVAQCKVQGTYPLMYYPHNIHFMAACAFLEGNSKKAIETAWMVNRKADRKFLAENATVQHYYSIPFYVMVHMGKWDEILQLQQPGESLLYPRAVWHYARGMAFSAKGNLPDGKRELAALEKIASEPSLATMLIWETNNAGNLVQIASNVLKGELAGTNKQFDASIKFLQQAADMEDALTYQEPPDWFFSVRQSLGHWLMQAGRYAEAEKIYRQDLEIYKENGWSLMGLFNSLKAQQKQSEATLVKARFDKAWQWADIKISSSRKY